MPEDSKSLSAENEKLIQEIDHCVEMARKLGTDLGRGTGGRENSLVITQLQQAGHWAMETRWQLLDGVPVPAAKGTGKK